MKNLIKKDGLFEKKIKKRIFIIRLDLEIQFHLKIGLLWLKQAIFSLIAECIKEIIAHILNGVRIIQPLINYLLELTQNSKMRVQWFQ